MMDARQEQLDDLWETFDTATPAPVTPAPPVTFAPVTSAPVTSAPVTSVTPAPTGKTGSKVLQDFSNFWLSSKQDRLLGGACHQRPWGCFQQLLIGTLAVAVAWTAIAWFVDGKPPSMFKLLKFAAIFLPVSFFLRWLDVEIQDKLSIAAGMTLGNKMVQILTM